MRETLWYLAQLAAAAIAESLADNRRYEGKRCIMFWSASHRPQSHVNGTARVTPGDMLTAIAVLRAGEVLERYLGYADCRICGQTLGTKDLTAFDFVWPEGAEHYIMVHGVWVPGMDELLAAVKSGVQRKSTPRSFGSF
jgi:hypothetical protein